VWNDLTLAHNVGSVGTYNLNGGTLTVGRLLAGSGTATFNWSGGALKVTNDDVAIGSSSLLGTALLLDGTRTLSAQSETVALDGTITHSAGSNTVTSGLTVYGGYDLSGSGSLAAGSETVGYPGGATVTQTGGTNTVTNGLTLSNGSGTSGIYNLNGGTLSVGTLSTGSGAATFNWGGGTLEVKNGGISVGGSSPPVSG